LSCLAVQLSLFFSYFSVPHRVLPSFPTRRSSDLEDLLQLGEDVRHQRFQRRTGIASLDARLLRNVLWRADAGHDILTLRVDEELDRKSTRLNSSHVKISYAVFCLKKKKNNAYILQ